MKTSLTGRRLEKLYSSFNRLRLVSFFFFLFFARFWFFEYFDIRRDCCWEYLSPFDKIISFSFYIHLFTFILVTFIFSLYPGLLKREDDEMVTLYSQIKNTANTRRSVFKTSLRVYIYMYKVSLVYLNITAIIRSSCYLKW